MKQRDRKGGFLLPIIGAGIVLITFVLKDAVRENLRDISDQLDRELNFSLLLQRDREILEKLDYAYQRIRYPNLNQGPSTDLGATSDPYQNLMTMRTLIRATILPNLDVIGRLLAVSAHNKSLDAEANQLRSRLNALSAQSFEIEHASFPHAPEPLTPGNEYDSAKRKVVEFTLALDPVRVATRDLLDRVRAETERKRSQLELWYPRVTWMSYFLYALGWTLGLIGKMRGVDMGLVDD